MFKRLKETILEIIQQADLILLGLCCAASVFGIAMIYSATRYNNDNRKIIVQTAALLIGIVVYFAISMIDLELLMKRWKWIAAFDVLFILLLKSPFGVSDNTGNTAWLKFPFLPVSIGPAEVVKITFIILLALQARRVKGAALISIIAGTVIGIPVGITKIPATLFTMPDSLAPVFFNFDLFGALDVKYLPYLFVFFLPDFFSSFGTAIGIGGKAGFLDKNGDLPDIDKVFQVDSVAATLGSFFTIPVLITYLESGAGVEAGGRTGLTAITTAVMFLLILAVTPLALMIPAAATAPVLVYVGVSMMGGMKNLDYTDLCEYIPAFLCIAFTAFTFNIANGISVAFIAYVIMKIASGRASELNKGNYLLALLLAYYFYAIAGVK